MRILTCCALLVGTSSAEARPASTGWFAEGGLGAVTFLPDTNKDAGTGPAMTLRVGRDLFSWFSIGVQLAASSHEAKVPPPPTGEWFQLYRGSADGRIGGLLDTIAVFVEGGAGVAMISSNVLRAEVMPGQHFSLAIHGGAGVEYQTENRHYALGLAGDGFLLPNFGSMRA